LYLAQFEKKLDASAKNLHNDRFLKHIRIAEYDNMFFVKSQCRAEMKKSVSYCLDVVIDSDGCIYETQCECAAGMGPHAHCKHVCALLYSLYVFSQLGNIVTEQTCTQKLQTFHHCKDYTGSPIKAENLPSTSSSDVRFEPRPHDFVDVPSYNDYFRQVCINYHRVNRFPIAQCFPPANTYAVAHDHDYCASSPQDTWLQKSNVTDISSTDINVIEHATRGQSSSKVWFSERSKRITSSNFGRICKATDRTDFSNLASSLTSVKKFNCPSVAHGRKYENIAIAKYEKKFQCKTEKCGLFVCKDYPYLAASPDRLLHENTIVEVKCPYTSRDKMISPVSVPYLLYDDNGKLSLNPHHNYHYQVQGQMMCADKQACEFVVYTLKDLVVIRINRDDRFIEAMLTKLKHFFLSYFREAI